MTNQYGPNLLSCFRSRWQTAGPIFVPKASHPTSLSFSFLIHNMRDLGRGFSENFTLHQIYSTQYCVLWSPVSPACPMRVLFSLGASLPKRWWGTALPWAPKGSSPARGFQALWISTLPCCIQRERYGFPKEHEVSLSKTHLHLPPGIVFKVLENFSFLQTWMQGAPDVGSVRRVIPLNRKAGRASQGNKGLIQSWASCFEVHSKALRIGSRPSGSSSKFSSISSPFLLQSLHQVAMFFYCKRKVYFQFWFWTSQTKWFIRKIPTVSSFIKEWRKEKSGSI